MTLSRIGRVSMALTASVALGLGMTACGGGTIGFMWVVGTTTTSSQTSAIAGFKIDDYTGNLTGTPRSPYTSAGTNPTSIVVRPGGRYVYVVNSGSGGTARDGSVAIFSVGGDGTLNYQQSRDTAGGTPIWAVMDTSGSYLYVLDRIAPAASTYGQAGLGAVNVFSIDGNTGRLTVVTNNQVRDPNNLNIGYFPVGANPSMMQAQGGCLFVLDKTQGSAATNTALFPYQIQNGQLVTTVTGNFATSASEISSVTIGGSNVYLTDIGPRTNGQPTTAGSIYSYGVGSGCALNANVDSPYPNLPGAQNPVWTFTESRGRLLYVLNQSSNNANSPNSSISGFSIETGTNRLTQLPNSAGVNPFPVGSGPTCMVEDPTNKYLYTSNNVDGTVTGKVFSTSTGFLSDLQHGSKFSATTHANCLAVSGSTS